MGEIWKQTQTYTEDSKRNREKCYLLLLHGIRWFLISLMSYDLAELVMCLCGCAKDALGM